MIRGWGGKRKPQRAKGENSGRMLMPECPGEKLAEQEWGPEDLKNPKGCLGVCAPKTCPVRPWEFHENRMRRIA